MTIVSLRLGKFLCPMRAGLLFENIKSLQNICPSLYLLPSATYRFRIEIKGRTGVLVHVYCNTYEEEENI